MSAVILWFRRDLRLRDQAALAAATNDGPVIPVYVLDDETPGDRRMGGAARWWLHHSLASLAADLEEKGSRLVLRRGPAADVLAALAEEVGAKRVHAMRHYEPWWVKAQEDLADRVELSLHDGNYLAPPGSILTGSGTPYKIYTPFWRALVEQLPPPDPAYRPRDIPAPSSWPDSDELGDWDLLPTHPDWATGMADFWTPGEDGARARLEAFEDEVTRYDTQRNLPSIEGTSMLSPHLHHGEISPATVYHRVMSAGGSAPKFLAELGWRDYAQNVIAQFPDYPEKNAREDYGKFEWRDFRSSTVRDEYDAWTRGKTGYPIVDAGMRQLWAIGWMHNRVRMIAASFLVKHLLIDWREGERWFWDTLCDADYASNGVNWQWIAGTGIDSNMFTRIMAPLSQSEKFDSAAYIREWVPELEGLTDADIHDPPEGKRPKDYPEKLIGHREARERALEAYRAMKA